MRGRAIDLLLFSRASVSEPENVAGSSFSAHVVVFKPCKMLQSRDIVHPGCKIEMTLAPPLLLLPPPVRIQAGIVERRKILRLKIAILPLLMPLV